MVKKSFQKYIIVDRSKKGHMMSQTDLYSKNLKSSENFLRNSINYNQSNILSTFFVPVCVIVEAEQLIVQSIMVVRFNFGGYFFQGFCG